MPKQKITIADLIEGNFARQSHDGKIRISDLVREDRERNLPKLFCDNPQCELPINGDIVAYNARYHEFYHHEECANYAFANRAWKTGEIQIGHINYIPRDEALRIKSGLEKETR